LSGISRDLVLTISDDGVGFDLTRVRNTVGLGLVSMRERMHLVGGRFDISSKPGSGTRIQARVTLVMPGQ
jgi:signal transduction histidine kinase